MSTCYYTNNPMTNINELSRFSSEELAQELNIRKNKKGGGNGQPAQPPATPASATGNNRLIYGDDNRKDLYEITDPAILNDSDSVVALIFAKYIQDNGDGTSSIDITSKDTKSLDSTPYNYLDEQGIERAGYLCDDVRFCKQPIPANASGFLVAPNVIATAAHCVYENPEEESKAPNWQKPKILQELRFVFGFRMKDANTVVQTVPNTEIYEAEKVIDRAFIYLKVDWALVKLKHSVTNHRIARIREAGKVADDQSLHIIGHPLGLPLKYADHAKVYANQEKGCFSTNLDAFGGNSGSPVFNSQTHLVEGIHIVGQRSKFRLRNGGTCLVPRRLEDLEADTHGTTSTRTTEFAEVLKEVINRERWSEFQPIPGLCGDENQGGDVAVTDLNGNGRPDLITFHVQNPDGQNKGYYQVGRDLDASGNVIGGWSPFLPIPGRFGCDTHGAGIAVADVNKSGRPDLIVFHIEKTVGGNRGYYRIGCELDDKGNVTRGWTDIKEIPGRLGVSNQGAGIAVADLNGNGKPDLIVFHIDDPEGENKGYYRIGRDLDVNGNVTGGWSEFVRVPGWFGAETQGAGIAIADVNGNGRPDLIVFHMDHPTQGEKGNVGYYRIGRDLNPGGVVMGGWSEPRALPHRFGHENQGAGIATAQLANTRYPHLVTFFIDNPPGGNKGQYQVGWILP